jgi:hypothetical protein
MFFSLPLDAGRRLPQSVQKIKEPIAAILRVLALAVSLPENLCCSEPRWISKLQRQRKAF